MTHKIHHIPDFVTPPSVLHKIAALPSMHINELRQLWSTLFDTPFPKYGRKILEKRMAFQLQAQAHEQVCPGIIAQQQKHIDALIERLEMEQSAKRDKKRVQLPPGTVLTRLYNGVDYVVTVTSTQQFEFRGRLYSSLSKIARDITGTHWSGPLFFGLNKSTEPNRPSKKACELKRRSGLNKGELV